MTHEEDTKLSPQSKKILGIVFLTLFIDLIGFSIIFPLFPSMLQYYQQLEGNSGLFGAFYQALDQFARFAGVENSEWGRIVLFGGLLGSLYSFLQFICTPFFGIISDKIGRRPVLIVSLTGILISYAIWFVADSFALLVLSRILGGIMSANIATASAIVADITTPKNRSKGMAIIGVAFGLGFVGGPLIGGFSSMLDLTTIWPTLTQYGVNPYSVPALIAFLLTAINLAMVILRLPETRPTNATPNARPTRRLNPRVLFHTEAYPGVSRTNLTYFLFIAAFSGMEFSLTFLATDKLGYTPIQNAYMFLFIGLILAFVQGGYVRRQSARIGTKKMTIHGFVALIPGLLLIGFAGHQASNILLYLGLFLLAVGAAQATPCLTALVSVYTPENDQGRILGLFRSLGALGRALGPIAACILYWRLGPTTTYILGAAFLIAPLALATTLPKPDSEE